VAYNLKYIFLAATGYKPVAFSFRIVTLKKQQH